MNTNRTTTTTPARSIVAEIASETADFVLGALPMFAALGGIVALFVLPLVLLARSVGAL